MSNKPNDQASNLRKMVEDYRKNTKSQCKNNSFEENKQEDCFESISPFKCSISVVSGKGGAGKSSLALNLALAFCFKGVKTLLADGDTGMANIHLLCSKTGKAGIADLSHRTLNKEELISVRDKLFIISGTSGSAENADSVYKNFIKLKNNLYETGKDMDLLITDTGTGLCDSFFSFSELSDGIIVITTPDPLSVRDTFGIIKEIYERYNNKKIYLWVNMVKNFADGKIISDKLKESVYLSFNKELIVLPPVLKSDKMKNCIVKGTPFLLYENNRQSRHFFDSADVLIKSYKLKTPFFNGFMNKIAQTIFL